MDNLAGLVQSRLMKGRGISQCAFGLAIIGPLFARMLATALEWLGQLRPRAALGGCLCSVGLTALCGSMTSMLFSVQRLPIRPPLPGACGGRLDTVPGVGSALAGCSRPVLGWRPLHRLVGGFAGKTQPQGQCAEANQREKETRLHNS
jgi:hypothetical protein